MGRSQFVLNLLASLLENESCFVVVATMKLRRGESTINDGQRLLMPAPANKKPSEVPCRHVVRRVSLVCTAQKLLGSLIVAVECRENAFNAR